MLPSVRNAARSSTRGGIGNARRALICGNVGEDYHVGRALSPPLGVGRALLSPLPHAGEVGIAKRIPSEGTSVAANHGHIPLGAVPRRRAILESARAQRADPGSLSVWRRNVGRRCGRRPMPAIFGRGRGGGHRSRSAHPTPEARPATKGGLAAKRPPPAPPAFEGVAASPARRGRKLWPHPAVIPCAARHLDGALQASGSLSAHAWRCRE